MRRRTQAFGLVLLTAWGVTLVGCGRSTAKSPEDFELPLPRGSKLLPARLRRLTNLELERSLSAVTGLPVSVASELPPDLRQEGYTPNATQDVSAAWALRYSALVQELAERAVKEKLNELAPCANAADAACRKRTVESLGRRAFRRPLESDEQLLLESALQDGSSERGSFANGVEVLLRALLESPSFVYESELGDGGAAGSISHLNSYEIASSLAYTLRGAPPDEELLEAARAGSLQSGAARVQQARRLLAQSDTRYQFRRFALEWLEVDSLLDTAKSTRLFPSYEQLKPHMLTETESFVDEVLVNGGASVQALLTGGFASVDPEMARFYGLKTYGPRANLSGTGRLGVLQQASFLAAHAHEDVTSPVKRGDFVMRKLLCEKVKRPSEVGLEVVMPPPSDRITNRQRFDAHTRDPGCAACHTTLDSLGFTFETFDAMGGLQTSDHGHPIVSQVEVKLGPKLARLPSSVALTESLAENPTVSECFARHAFRYFSAQAEPGVEESFLSLRRELPEGSRDSLFDSLLAYVGSDLFVLREVKAP